MNRQWVEPTDASPIYSLDIYRHSQKHNIHQTVVGACTRTGVRKISTNSDGQGSGWGLAGFQWVFAGFQQVLPS